MDTKRFLDALECPEDAALPGAGRHWPLGVSPPAEPSSDHPLDYQFLSTHSIGHYLESLCDPASLRGAPPRHYSVDFAALDDDWSARLHPLALSEYLAYKSGLAYRTPRRIRNDLLGLDPQGRRYKEGVDQFAFFDSSRPGWSFAYPDSQAFVFVHHRTGYLIFRGSSSFSDWNTNLFSDLTTETYANLETRPQTHVGSPRPARHTGFAIAWGSIAANLELWVRDQMRNGRIDKIVLSGHSLGGALAILGAFHFARHNICPVHAVITFGAPKVGGLEFKAAYEDPRLGLKERTLRVESAEDVVALFSKRSGDQHVGHVWKFSKRPLRPTWQMLLFAPMVEAEKKTKIKVERMERKRDAEAAKREAEDARRQWSPPAGSNEPRPQPRRTWPQFVSEMLLKLIWFLAKLFVRALAAHSVENRYGLYISTLAYRRIRHHHEAKAQLRCQQSGNQENKRIAVEGAYMAANRDLARHLKIMRGRHPRTFRYLANRPIRIETPKQLAEYRRKYVNYIA